MLAGFEGCGPESPSGTAYGVRRASVTFPGGVAGKTGTADTENGQGAHRVVRGVRARRPTRSTWSSCVIDQAGYGATAAAPVVGQIYNYLASHPVTAPGDPPQPRQLVQSTTGPVPLPTTSTTTTDRRTPGGEGLDHRHCTDRRRAGRGGGPWPNGRPRTAGLESGEMQSLWPRVEPLLAQVTKPARYIGGELGAQAPSTQPEQVAWLLVYPDTYEIGLPNQGLQILYEILNERDDAVAERAYAPWVDMEAAMRAAGVPLFSLENHLPAARLRRAGLQPLGRARLHQRPQPDRPGRRAGPRRRRRSGTTRWWWPAATAPSTPSPWPTSSTASCSATARRRWARSPR